MPSKIILKITQGSLCGREFVFDETACCIVGRADDCSPQLPSDEAHRTVSRHHCLLDINPPDIRVRDFGSLNGTYVNRQPRLQPGNPVELKSGDEIIIGKTFLKLTIEPLS